MLWYTPAAMADTNVTDLTIAWLWVIEYLACFQHLDSSILHDLIEAAPELPNDLSKGTREMVALRCLEDLFGWCDGLTDEFSSASDQRYTLDFAESCEDVLQSVLQNISVPDWTEAELSRWDIHPFIMHKRASLPKCSLEQIKDAMIGGSHPCAASLKEPSGLVQAIDEHNKISVDDIDDNGKTWRIFGNDPIAQDIAPEETSSLLVENGNGIVGDDLHNQNLVPSKRGRASLDEEALLGNHRENLPHIGDGDDHLNAKRFKQGALCIDQSIGQVPIHGKDLVGDPSERTVEIIEEEGQEMEREPQVAGFEENVPLKDGCDEPVAVTLVRSHAADSNNGFEHEHIATVFSHQSPQDTSGDGPDHCILVDEADDAALTTSNSAPFVRSQHKGSVDEARDDSDHGNQLNSQNTVALNNSYGNTGIGVEGEMSHMFEEDTSTDSDEHRHEKYDVAKKKSHFLNSQCMLSHDSLETAEWTEQNLCVKCGEAGQLLVCSASGCPLAFHVNCLASSVKFDDSGNFYCPFCAYSRAISEYLESKRKASLAKKELIAFIRSSSDHQLKKPAERLQTKEHSNSGQNGDKSTQENVDEGIERESSDQQTTNSPKKPVCSINVDGDNTSDGSQLQTKEHDSLGQNGDNNDLSKTYENVVGGAEREASEQHTSDSSKKYFCSINVDGGDRTDDEKSMISNYSMRLRRGDRQYTYPATLQMRRKKVPWTAKEEEILKDGVQNFSTDNGRSIPWKKILEFGDFVFMNGRTAVDLKDKWRNMCRGSPKSK